jgi:cytochrome o ubiquinol oxidase subunit 2
LNRLKLLALLPLAALMSGCNFVVLSPSGDIAVQQRNLVVISTVLMLLIIVPVMALTVFFAWRYRSSNTTARYEPEWHHSTKLELVIWSAPLLIIICLGALTWMGTHLLDPFRPLQRIAAGKPIDPNVKPLTVDVVALDWKWLFIYPEQGIATVNQVAAPVDRPIDFHITASSVMNSFFIPALAGQIYAMPGMDTQLHAVINKAGTYKGFSANYSGAGFSGMRFAFLGLSDQAFDGWVGRVKAAGGALQKTDYLQLERPSLNDPVRHYASVDPDLYRAILNMCVEPGKMCESDMMTIDEKGGLGLAGIRNTLPLTYDDKHARRGAVFGAEPSYVAALCTPAAPRGQETAANGASPNATPVPGAEATLPLLTPAGASTTSFLLGMRRKSES